MQKIFTPLSLLIMIMGISCAGPKKPSMNKELFKSSVFTPAKSFTSGAEGPAVDKDGNLYAVNCPVKSFGYSILLNILSMV